MKLRSDLWFSTIMGCCGIMLTEDEVTGEHKAYIGVVGGLDIKADQQHIMDYGQKLPYGVVEDIATWLKPKKEEHVKGG